MRNVIAKWAGLLPRSKRTEVRPFYFLHIPKTAGTSVTTWLQARLGPNAVCPAGIWDQLTRLEAAKLREYSVFCGHFGVDLRDYLGRELTSASVFRDPVARTRSHYGHVFRDTEHPRHRHVARQSFQAFVLDQENWPMVENFQARYLLKTPLRFEDFRGGPDGSTSKRNRLSVLSEDARYLFDRTYVREKSTEAFGNLDIVGVTEDIAAFLRALANETGLIDAGTCIDVPRENTAVPDVHQYTLDEGATEVLMNLTVLDRELYSAACLRTPGEAAGICVDRPLGST